MADNITLNPGTLGDTIAADDIGPGVKHQRVKVEYGDDGSATDSSIAAPFPVAFKTPLTPAAPAAVSVGVSTGEAVAANANRKALILTNTTSNATISLGFAASAVLNSGVTLFPGGVFRMDGSFLTVGAVNAIASAAASNLAVQEYT